MGLSWIYLCDKETSSGAAAVRMVRAFPASVEAVTVNLISVAMPWPSMSLAVVGAQYPNDDKKAPTRLFAIGLCRPGDPVALVPEPKNKHDDQAIMVWNADGMMMGYITAERAPLIHKMMREGREIAAIFQIASDKGAWIRAAFDGEAPTLPSIRAPKPKSKYEEVVDPDSSFYPDEEYPDS